MTAWLLPIIGVVIVGVLVELVSGDTRMGKFVRSIYSFIILFVIVQPIPKLLNEKVNFFENSAVAVNGELLEQINSGVTVAKQKQVENLLTDLGYGGCIVYIDESGVFINPAWHLSAGDEIKIKQAVAVSLGIDIKGVFIL
jgi:hypothetical protein